MAGTSARSVERRRARCRCLMFRKAGSAAAAPGSSIRPPTARNARSPRRHRPNRSANVCNYIRPTTTRCDGRSRSALARRCAASVTARAGMPPHVMIIVNASWAVCPYDNRRFALFRSGELQQRNNFATRRQFRGLSWAQRSKCLWTMRNRPDTIFMTPV
jgi:hypothetical protein